MPLFFGLPLLYDEPYYQAGAHNMGAIPGRRPPMHRMHFYPKHSNKADGDETEHPRNTN